MYRCKKVYRGPHVNTNRRYITSVLLTAKVLCPIVFSSSFRFHAAANSFLIIRISFFSGF